MIQLFFMAENDDCIAQSQVKPFGGGFCVTPFCALENGLGICTRRRFDMRGRRNSSMQLGVYSTRQDAQTNQPQIEHTTRMLCRTKQSN